MYLSKGLVSSDITANQSKAPLQPHYTVQSIGHQQYDTNTRYGKTQFSIESVPNRYYSSQLSSNSFELADSHPSHTDSYKIVQPHQHHKENAKE